MWFRPEVSRACSGAAQFSPVALATTRGDEGERFTSLDEMPAEVLERERSDAEEKFTKQLLFGSRWVTGGGAAFFSGLLCYCVSLNKSEGCLLDRQPPPRAFIRHLLLSSGGNV